MLRAITFDFWGTLYQDAYAYEDRLDLLSDALMSHRQPRSRARIDAAYNHARGVWDRVWRGEQRSIPIERWLDELLDHLSADLPDEAMARLGQAMEEIYLGGKDPQPVEGVTAVLPNVAERYAIGLISDTGLTPGRVLRRVLQRDGLLRFFDVLTFSDEFGIAKPCPEPFLHTLGRLNAEPAEAVHIGDLPETDLQGARQVGMRTILFLGVSGRADGREASDAAFADYADLEHILEQFQ